MTAYGRQGEPSGCLLPPTPPSNTRLRCGRTPAPSRGRSHRTGPRALRWGSIPHPCAVGSCGVGRPPADLTPGPGLLPARPALGILRRSRVNLPEDQAQDFLQHSAVTIAHTSPTSCAEPKEWPWTMGVPWDFSGTSGCINGHGRETAERQCARVSCSAPSKAAGHRARRSLPEHLTIRNQQLRCPSLHYGEQAAPTSSPPRGPLPFIPPQAHTSWPSPLL